MKLHLKTNPQEIFDAPRGIGLALIQSGAAEAHVEPQPPIDREVKWSILGYPEKQLFLKAECPACHQCTTMEGVTPFRHCGRLDEVPEEFADTMRAHLASRNPRK